MSIAGSDLNVRVSVHLAEHSMHRVQQQIFRLEFINRIPMLD